METADTLNPPSIRAPAGASNSSRYIIFMIDVDVARNGTRVPLLHWLVPNVAIAANGSLSIPVPTNGSAGGVPGAVYAQPSPPVGDIPHRYTQILFAQPASFVFPASFSYVNPVNPANATARVGFNITQFIQAAGLSAPLAANYISVQNLTGVTGTATTFPPYNPTSTAVSNRNGTSVVPFPGAASQMVSVSWIWSTAAVIGAGVIAAGMIAL